MKIARMGRLVLAVLAALVLGSCGGSESATTTTVSASDTTPETTVATTTETADVADSGSTLSAAEQANSGIHTYRADVEILECGAEPPPSVYENRRFEVVVGTDQISYQDLESDLPPLVWERTGTNTFAREFTNDDGEHLAYTLTLDETSMVYYYDIDTVPCRRITWTIIDN